ncbi:MAG: radical SAM protein [Kiritimatiellia bacterium]|nr:radical SAM protein [Kiritimatiellia bacterium]
MIPSQSNLQLDLLLINPSLDWRLETEKKTSMRVDKTIPNLESPHIGMAYLLAVAKKTGIKTKYCDMVADGLSVEELIDFIKETKPRLIGMTAFTVQIRAAGIIAEHIKAAWPQAVIMIGGCHASALPAQTLGEFSGFDFVVCGEGEVLLPSIFELAVNLDSLRALPGIICRGPTGAKWEPIKAVDSIPFPAWDALDLSKYAGVYPHRTRQELPMVTARGCPFRCTFCCRALGSKMRRRSVASVITEIEHNIEQYGCESIAFADETFIFEKKWAEAFFNEMLRKGLHRKITWSCSTRVSNMSPELFRRMRATGCYYIFFGLESADNDTLKRIKKGTTVAEIRNAIQWCKQAGIIPVGAFIIGLEGDSEEHVHKAVALGRELDLFSITFPIAVPFPGTELRSLALRGEYGLKIMSDNWDLYGKQDPGVMESADFSLARRKELQQIAYAQFPKQKLAKYLDRQRAAGHPFVV